MLSTSNPFFRGLALPLFQMGPISKDRRQPSQPECTWMVVNVEVGVFRFATKQSTLLPIPLLGPDDIFQMTVELYVAILWRHLIIWPQLKSQQSWLFYNDGSYY